MNAAAALVSDPREVTPEWLTAVLRARDPRFPSIASIERESIGTGQVGRCVRFHCRFADSDSSAEARAGAPASFVGKFPSDDARSLQAAKDHRTYLLEVGFYRELQSTVAVRTPRCFHHAISSDAARFVLVLEDMRGARQGDQLAGCSVEQARAALCELAALHAPRWGDPTLGRIEWLEGPSRERARITGDLYRQVLPGFIERFGPKLDVAAVRIIERLAPALDDELAADDAPQTIVHRDFRVDNLLFGDGVDAPPVTVVDWQTLGRGAAASDVAYFLGASLRTEDRRASERALIDLYVDELARRGVSDLDSDRFFDQYRRQSTSGIVMAVVASMIVEVTERGDAMFLAMARRHSAHALDADVASLWKRT
jgi:aminoglycoside/choline kinase family phosphotransferase